MSEYNAINDYYTVKPQNRTFDMAKAFIDRVYERRFGSKGPRQTLRKIQVAGTNGKGSTSTMLASVLTAAGYKTGLYTSPSLFRVNDRIAIDGQCISDEALALYMPIIRGAQEDIGCEFGGFERITAACYLYFLDQQVDFAVMETGLGGRFDTVSAIDGLILGSLTSINMDHMNMLGTSLQEIANDKCGIMRPGVTMISHPQLKVVRDTIKKCAYLVDARVRFTTSLCKTVPCENTSEGQSFAAVVSGQQAHITINLTGAHQRLNAINALCCIYELNAMGLTDISIPIIEQGFKTARIDGRFQYLQIPGLSSRVLVDGAHNPSGMDALMNTLDAQTARKRKYITLLCIMADKDIEGILKVMAPHVSQAICVSVNERALPAKQLALMFNRLGVDTHVVDNVSQGLALADKLSMDSEDILVTGSLYLVSEVLKLARSATV